MSVLSQRLTTPHRERVVKNPLPWYTPRFWHGMRFSTWSRRLLQNRLAISPTRIPMALSITGFSGMNSVLAGLEQLFYGRQIAAVELEHSPLFILGHWRSGTTFLHELLIRDPSHSYPTTYQCFAPHHFVLSEPWVTPWSEFLLPSRRPMDNMAAGWERPQEDEFALGNLGVPSPYLSMMFPNLGEVHREYLTLADLSDRERRRWEVELRRFFQRLSLRDKRRIIVKSPPHTARVRTLRAMFPGARFVHIARQPEALYVSTIALWRSLNAVQGLQVVRDESWIERYVIDSLQRMYEAYLQDRSLLAANELVEVRYEDLVADPKRELKSIYGHLELGDFAAMEAPLESYLADVQNYRVNRHDYDCESTARLRDHWGLYYDQFGY